MFTEDSRTENFLTQLGVKWAYRNGIRFPLDFAANWNTENIGRPVAVRDDAVKEYAAQMVAGSAAPAPILVETPAGFMVLDGVQRLSAEELQKTTRISAYVVTTTSAQMLSVIRVIANPKLQGRAEPAEWSRRRAVEVLIVQDGMSPAEVAKLGGWSATELKRIAEAIELQVRIHSVGGPTLADTMLVELRPYIEGNSVLEQAAVPVVGFMQMLKKSKLAADDARTFIELFFEQLPKSANPYKEYTKRLDALHDDPEIRARITGRQSTELTRDIVLLRAMKSADNILDRIMTHGDTLTNIDEYNRISNSIAKKLKAISINKKKRGRNP